MWKKQASKELTIGISQDIIQVKTGLDVLAVFVLQLGDEEVVVLEADVCGTFVETHFRLYINTGYARRTVREGVFSVDKEEDISTNVAEIIDIK